MTCDWTMPIQTIQKQESGKAVVRYATWLSAGLRFHREVQRDQGFFDKVKAGDDQPIVVKAATHANSSRVTWCVELVAFFPAAFVCMGCVPDWVRSATDTSLPKYDPDTNASFCWMKSLMP